MTIHSFVAIKIERRQGKFVARINCLSPQSSKKKVEPYCRDKLAIKTEDIEVASMSRHFTTLSRHTFMESYISNCRDKATT